MKRTRINPRSQKSLDASPLHDLIRAEVFARDDHRCRLATARYHHCRTPLTVHHIKKSSQGGRYEKANLVSLCAGANSWVEDFPITAHDLGLVCRRGDTLEECWSKMQTAGLVSYGPNGEPTVPTGRPT